MYQDKSNKEFLDQESRLLEEIQEIKERKDLNQLQIEEKIDLKQEQLEKLRQQQKLLKDIGEDDKLLKNQTQIDEAEYYFSQYQDNMQKKMKKEINLNYNLQKSQLQQQQQKSQGFNRQVQITLKDLEKIRVSRSFLQKIVFQNFFEKTVKGCMVRIVADGSRKMYVIAQVLDVVVYDKDKYYELEGKKTNKLLRLKHASNERIFQMNFISNGNFQESEFGEYKYNIENQRLDYPDIEFIKEKSQQIQRAMNYKYDSQEIENMVNSNMENTQVLQNNIQAMEFKKFKGELIDEQKLSKLKEKLRQSQQKQSQSQKNQTNSNLMLQISKNQLLYKQQVRQSQVDGSNKKEDNKFNELENMYQQAATKQDYARIEDEYRSALQSIEIQVDYDYQPVHDL